MIIIWKTSGSLWQYYRNEPALNTSGNIVNDNTKLLQQSKSGFKRTINWNNFQSKVTMQRRNQYLDYSIDPSFQGVNRLFVLSFKDDTRTSYMRHFLLNAKIKTTIFWLMDKTFLVS